MLSSTANAFKYLGSKFKDLFESFKSMFKFKGFKLPKLNFKSIAPGFKKAADAIKPMFSALRPPGTKDPCDNKADKWNPGWGKKPSVVCGEWAHNSKWGALKGGKTIAQSCASFGNKECAKTCCEAQATDDYMKVYGGACTGGTWLTTAPLGVKSVEACLGKAKAYKTSKPVTYFTFASEKGECAFYTGVCSDGDKRTRFNTYKIMTEMDQEMMLATTDKFAPGAAAALGYLSVKHGQKKLGPILEDFCEIVKVFTNPIKNAFNKVIKVLTSIIPKWLLRITVFAGFGGLASFFFQAFTVGYGFGYTLAFAKASFEAGFALEINKDLTIGNTGCYVGGSSGVDSSIAEWSPFGLSVTTFKEYGNIAGESATVGLEGDICKLLGLPCKISITAAAIFDNADWDPKKETSEALKTRNKCLGKNAEYSLLIEEIQLKHQMMLNLVQTMSEEELEKNILRVAYDFFTHGFGKLFSCIKHIFGLWIGFQLSVDAGVSISPPAKASFTIDFEKMTPIVDSWPRRHWHRHNHVSRLKFCVNTQRHMRGNKCACVQNQG